MDMEAVEMGQFLDRPYSVIAKMKNKQIIEYLKNSVHPKRINSKADL